MNIFPDDTQYRSPYVIKYKNEENFNWWAYNNKVKLVLEIIISITDRRMKVEYLIF